MAMAGTYGYLKWPKSAPLPQYRTETLVKGNIVKSVSANGTLNPVVLVNVGTQISGVVNKLNVDFNDRVKKNQVLAEIDPALINAQLEQSQANLANANASLKLAEANASRAKELYGQDYIPRSERDQSIQALAAAQAQVKSAQGVLKRDKTNLGYTIIKSPVSGVVVSRSIDIGQTVAASFTTPTLFKIAQDLKRMQIDTSVAEADVGGVRIGQAVSFTVDAYADRLFKGKVRRVRLDSTVLQNVVTYDVVVDVNNPEEILLPGMTAFVSIVIKERLDTLKLPLAALKFRPSGTVAPKSGNIIYRLVDNKVQAIPVQIGIADGKYVELMSGDLKAGDAVILEDLQLDKTKVQSAAKENFRIKAF
ncbi:Efflux transporter, RND family, MFP subunit [Crenothrix polyspora]|uniref:Efflux transporter, RND family, MFP subunit n=2 Tax=Crenothrix polyspora TaxID=360316 RepID=A0A1R4H690_9GAMM|nr:Efflux transporter, RND family, MFP subunit [Crenothrix polyspora]